MEKCQMIKSILWGAVFGDAFGASGVGYTPETLLNAYGSALKEFVEPIPANDKKTKWGYAEITDDTQMLLLTLESCVDTRMVCRIDIGRRVMELNPKYANPRSATGRFQTIGKIDMLADWPGRTGFVGRSIPIGLLTPPKTDEIIRNCVRSTIMTHGNIPAMQGSVAVAGVFSTLMSGWEPDKVLEFAAQVASRVDHFGVRVSSGDIEVSTVIEENKHLLQAEDESAFLKGILELYGTGYEAWECIPAGIYIGLYFGDIKEAVRFATNIGGDADTTAQLAGSVAGAIAGSRGGVIPDDWVQTVTKYNSHVVERLNAIIPKIEGMIGKVSHPNEINDREDVQKECDSCLLKVTLNRLVESMQ